MTHLDRRQFLATSAALALGASRPVVAKPLDRSLIAITLDLEMSRQYPTRDQMHWDYEKGNLDGPTKAYSVEAGRRVKAKGGRIHYFCVGRVLEQENVDWLKELVGEGHAIGNHTYDHVNVGAKTTDQLQFRFQRAPWLIEGKTPAQVISENIRLTNLAMKSRLGIAPNGFRTPGGFADGLVDRADVQALIRGQGFSWVSSKYPAHPSGKVGAMPTEDVLDATVKAQSQAQPFIYESGLVEIPMSPVSDVTTMRSAQWPLEGFLEGVRRGVMWAIENRTVYDFLSHPSCLHVTDPKFRAIDMICDLVAKSNGRAEIVTLDRIAATVKA